MSIYMYIYIYIIILPRKNKSFSKNPEFSRATPCHANNYILLSK